MRGLSIGLWVAALSMIFYADAQTGTPSSIQMKGKRSTSSSSGSVLFWSVEMRDINAYAVDTSGENIQGGFTVVARRTGNPLTQGNLVYMVVETNGQRYCTRWATSNDHNGRSVQFQFSIGTVNVNDATVCPTVQYGQYAEILIQGVTPGPGQYVPLSFNTSTGDCGIPAGIYEGQLFDGFNPACAADQFEAFSDSLLISSTCQTTFGSTFANVRMWCVTSGGPADIFDSNNAANFVVLSTPGDSIVDRNFYLARYVQQGPNQVVLSIVQEMGGDIFRVEHALDETFAGTRTFTDPQRSVQGVRWELIRQTCDTANPCATGQSSCMMGSDFRPFCLCNPGFTDQYCQTNINDCLDHDCVYGVCVDGHNSFSCDCFGGWTGARCNVSPQYCSSLPCINGGTCREDADALGYTCDCLLGYSGENCQITPCTLNPCQHNGVCITSGSSYQCQCPPGYSGSRCEITPCTRNPCQNNGVCITDGSSYLCRCEPGYSGPRCEIKHHCYFTECLNGGTCDESPYDFVCACRSGYTGRNCEKEVICDRNPCMNGGVCYPLNNDGYACNCRPGYTGMNCEQAVPCYSSPCKNGGTCFDSYGGSYTCFCDPGHTGTYCEEELPCASQPCLHGTCSEYGDGYKCTCDRGYQGARCDQVDYCYEQPCLNGGSCHALRDAYLCICDEGFKGQHCEHKKPCVDNPCKHGAYCEARGDDYVCICTGGNTGKHCEIPIAPCKDHPCVHGNCRVYANTAVCDCDHGYTGRFCEVPVEPECYPPCQHGGQCVDSPTGPHCRCHPGYTGSICETDITELPCYDNPCEHGGSCIPTIWGGYTCECPKDFEGEHCENVVNPCMPNPCDNDGVCQARPGGYVCRCGIDYTGPRCEEYKCASVVCENGGTCKAQDFFQAPTVCVCPPGFKGPYCEHEDGCSQHPCKNGGVCSMEYDEYHCKCPRGYEGRQCELMQCPCLNGGYCSPNRPGQCSCPDGYEGPICEEKTEEDMFDYTALIIILVVLFILGIIVVGCLCFVCRRMKKKEEVVEVFAEPTPVKKEITVAAPQPQIRVVQMAPKTAAPQVIKAVAVPQYGPLTLSGSSTNMTAALYNPGGRPQSLFEAPNAIYGTPYGAVRTLNPSALQQGI